MDHEAIRQAIAAYALDAIDGEERTRVEAELLEHLPGCADCATMMREFRELAGDLAVAAPPRPVPADVERRVVRSIGGEPAARPAARRGGALRVGAIAAALALGVSVAGNAILAIRAGDAGRRADALARAFSLAGDPESRAVALRGREGAMVLAFRPGGRAVLLGDRIPDPPPGRVLELWLLRDGRPVAVQVFRPDRGLVLVEVRADPEGYEAVAVTVERRMVPAPTGDPVYAGTLRA